MRTGYAFLLKKFSPLLPVFGRAFATSERPGAHFPLVYYCRLNWEVAGPAGTASRLPSSDLTFLLSPPGSLRRDLPSLL